MKQAAVALIVTTLGCDALVGAEFDVQPRAATTTSTGGMGGVGGAGGAGGGGGALGATLTQDNLVVRYFIDEAESGSAPTHVRDAADNPFDLALAYADGLAYDVLDSNRGLRWLVTGSTDAASNAISGTKVESRLNGATRATAELVVALEEAAPTAQILSLGAQTLGFTVGTDGQDAYHVNINGARYVEVTTGWSSQRSVLHAVLDSTESLDADRVILYVDGERVSADPPAPFAESDTIMLPDGTYLTIGNRLSLNRSPQGMILYAALYDAAFDPARVMLHSEALLASDDQP